MNHKRSMTNRVLAMLLSLVLCLSLVPQTVFATSDVSGGAAACVTVKDGAKTAYEVAAGGLLTVRLDELFQDSGSHGLTYTLDGGDYGTQTKVTTDKDGSAILSFTNPTAGTYTPTITATCAEKAAASVQLTITVNEAADGDAAQYGYDETDAASVKVYVTVSHDGIPLVGNEGTVLSHLELDVPYFDLDKQDMSEFYRYHTENGQGGYVDDQVVKRPTALHLYLYLLGVYYLGLTPEQVINGDEIIKGHDGGVGVTDMNGGQPYDDSSLALNITGSATSMYMQQFWGHDENLMYYRNHVYPLMSAGWGATADYMLLSDGDTIDVAMFSNWSFWQSGAFAAFDRDSYAVRPGGSLTVQTQKYDTRSVADGGTESFEPITGLTVKVYDADWREVGEVAAHSSDRSSYTYTFEKEGTYYLLATDPNAGTEDACYAPATARVTVGGGAKPFDPNEYYKDFDFASVSLDAEGTDYLYHIAESTMEGAHYSNPGEKKVYTVTVPKGTETVYVTYPADFETNIAAYCALFNADGEVDWSYYAGSDYEYTVTENGDGSHTLALPAAFLLEKGLYIAAEDNDNNYEYFNCFNFVVGDNTKPGGAGEVAVTGVTLSHSELTVDRNATAQLTAAVEPANAANQKVTWRSGAPAVATVDRKGLVTGVAEGTALITVTTDDGAYMAKCTVTVTDVNKPAQAEDGYYEIATAGQLKWFADEVNSGKPELNARLTADIDLSGVCSAATPWTPIGDRANNQDYRGTFDGQNHKITGLYLENKGSLANVSSYYTALFGLCDGAAIKNVSVYGEAKAVTRYVAGIVGRACGISTKRTCTIENCHNYVTLTGEPTNDQIYGHAGVAASAQDTVIRGCSNNADITGYQGYTGGIVGNASAEVNITDCYNTGAISFYYKTQKIQQAAGGIVGLAGESSHASTITLTNCYATGTVSGQYDDQASMGALVGEVTNNEKTTLTANNCYYLDSAVQTSAASTATVTVKGTAFTAAEGLSAEALGSAYVDSCPAPVLKGQTAAEHKDGNNDGVCDTCGKSDAPVPTRKEGYPAASEATVQTGMAYLLSDLQAGKIFAPVDGQTLNYKNYYYQRSTDGGQTWGAMQSFSEAIFGATTIQLTELAAGDYTYRFCASHDGKHFSKDTWTLTLHVEDAPLMNFTFYVSKDYTGGYPVIKLYSVTTDAQGSEVLGEELKDCFLYSSFTDTLPEGQEAYEPANGQLVDGYQTFYASLTAGRYAYRAFAKNAETGVYDVELGGMTLELPTDSNVDGGAGGGTNVYLQCNSFYTNSRKTDNTYFTAEEYHVQVDCPIMKTSCVMGTPYVRGNYTYYPTVLYAAGNACLYNTYAYPDIDGYIFTQSINQTFRAGSSAGTKGLTINTGVKLTVTVPADAAFGLYFQWNNFNTTEVEPMGVTESDDGWRISGDTKSADYFISKSSGNYTWRLSQPGHVTRAGWVSGLTADRELNLTASTATDRLSHDFSQLGTATATRDEADLQVNLDPSGFEVLDGTTRVRAYRHWQIINSDAGNIMVEPDFHWSVMGDGDARIQTVNGGNTTANWADVTPGTKDSIITVYYDSVDVTTANPNDGTQNVGSHGGLYPATQPQRVGVIVVGGTGVTHGTADADVDFNMAPGVTTTRSMEWDYNYDTWYYEAGETDPALRFAVVKNTGSVMVEYAFVATNAAMVTSVSAFQTASVGEDGRYIVPLGAFNTAGNGMGGTVILRMTDESGVSYRLVRVAKVTITAENASHKGEDIMPGDQVKLTFSGMFRGVNKISGIFNPTLFKPTYHNGESKFDGTLGQYQRMDNSSVTVTVPEDLPFAEGADTAACVFTNGYTYGSMYSAANPFAFLYGMTDTGVGTNFNAVTVNYYMNHYADAAVTVYRKVFFNVALRISDDAGSVLDGVAVTITDSSGKDMEPGADGRFQLGYGTYLYTLRKDGYAVERGSFSLGSADADKVQDGVLTVMASMQTVGADPWDGTTKTEPQKDDNGVYLIGTAAELAWFAATDGKSSAKLTADIELAGYDWTPLKKFYGTFDGQGHVIRNLYINSTNNTLGLISYLQGGASVTGLGITGSVTCTNNTRIAQAGGIAGYMYDKASITQCWSAVNVTSNKHAGGIAGYTATGAVITDCYATGMIRSSAANECYLGGICGSGFSNTAGATLTNCYSVGKIVGTGGNASYVGGLSPDKTAAHYVNSFYLTGTVSGESPKYGITGLGTAKTADELKALASELGSSFAADTKGLNDGYPILKWQAGAEPVLTGLKITAQPAKTAYLAGEDFDPTGMTVVAVYDDNTEVEIRDYTMENDKALKAETTAVTVKYGDFSVEQTITVAQKYNKGDVNNDGMVDDVDAALAYAIANGKLTADLSQQDAADINGDGQVTAKDAEIIYAFYLGELTSLTANN
ncbi:MAG: Ig-like domain-containing protein [Oscillospiraceae bacterium]